MLITGTFLYDGIGDVPCNNWGRKEWDRDFQIMRAIGIDTVVPLRSGSVNWANYPSEVLKKHADAFDFHEDLIGMFVELSEKYQMNFYLPTYSGWCNSIEEEREINVKVIDELWKLYGGSPAVKGWYVAFELNSRFIEWTPLVKDLGLHCKKVSNGLPTILSPYLPHSLWPDGEMNKLKNSFQTKSNLSQHSDDWDGILTQLEGAIDIVAFQDGHPAYHEFYDFLDANCKLMKKHNMQTWSNVESFSRDLPYMRFPPISWRSLEFKLNETAKFEDIQKVITFEFSSFMSPYSLWPSARHLFRRYCEANGLDADSIISNAELQR
jgi:hypothetical protein